MTLSIVPPPNTLEIAKRHDGKFNVWRYMFNDGMWSITRVFYSQARAENYCERMRVFWEERRPKRKKKPAKK